MPSRTRNTEVAFAREVTPGQAVTLQASDVGLIVSDASVTFTQAETEREPAGGSFTRRPPFAGLQTAQVSLSFPLAGPSSGAVADAPAWSDFLEAAGFRTIAVKKMAIASSTVSFTAGNVLKNNRIFTGNVTGATGRIVGSVWKGQGQTSIYYEELTGAIDNTETEIQVVDTDTRFSATVTLDTQTPVDGGTGWLPVSSEQLAIGCVPGAPTGGDGAIVEGELLRGSLSGCTLLVTEDYDEATLKYRACHRDPINGETLTVLNGDGDSIVTNSAPSQIQYPSLTVGVNEDGLFKVVNGAIVETFNISLESGAAPVCQVTLQGTAGTPIDQATFGTGVDPLQVAPRFLSAAIAAARYDNDNWALADQWDPALASLSFNVATSPTQREDAATPTGLKQFLGSDKVISGSMDPEQLNEGVFNHYEDAADKAPFRFFTSWGTAGQTPPNAFAVAADEMVFNTLNSTDRNGLFVLDGQFTCYGLAHDEWALLLL